MVNDQKSHHQVSHLMNILCKLMNQFVDVDLIRRSTNLPLSKRQFEILKILYISGNFTVSDLAKFLRISRAAASKSVNNLVKYRLVKRSIPSLDRRKVLVSILPAGKTIVKSYFVLLNKQSVEILSQFNEQDLKKFEKILYQYIHALMIEYQDEAELICLSCHSKFSEACPLEINGQTSCYHTLVNTLTEET